MASVQSRRVRNGSLRGKLSRAAMLTVVAALTIVTMALTYVQYDGSRRAAIETTEALGVAIAQNLGATLLFENQRAADEVLQSLSSRKDLIVSAVLWPDGELFTAIPSGTQTMDLAASLDGPPRAVEHQRVTLREPIRAAGETVGYLILVSRLEGFVPWFQSTAVVVLPVLLLSILLAALLARRQVAAILSPLDVFRQAMRCVGEGRTSGLYMPEVGDRELRPLVDGFNEMVTQLQHNRQLLSESEERYRRIVESQTEAICRLDRHFQLSFANPAFMEMVGYEADALYGARPAKLVPPEDCKYIEAAHARLSGENRSAPFSCRLLTSEGEVRWVEATLSASFDDLGRISEYLIVSRDVSKQKVAEQMAIQTSKLATLGEISTSIAHELKQPLSVMDMIAQNMMETLKEEDLSLQEMRSYAFSKAERIAANTVRLRAIIEHLRMFGRKVEGDTQVFDARESVKAALLLSQHRFERAGVRLRISQPDEALPVRGHTILFEQVLLNLLNNAADALEEQPGEASRAVEIEVARDRGLLRVVVEDSAGGMPDAALKRALEPYFTTKSAERGTGLGLSISSDILRDMEGGLSLENGAKGLQATITLPLALEDAKAGEEAAAQ